MQNNTNESTPSWFHPNYPSLKLDDIGEAAVNGQITQYPMVVRDMADPAIHGQKFGNVSFMLFDVPRRFKDKPIYGYMKIRGNHDSQNAAYKDSCRIVRDVDSKHMVRIAPVGVWVPITELDESVKEKYDVREDDKQILLRDEAVKEKEKEHAKIARELRDAEDRLKNGGDIYDEPESIKFYAMKRVTEMTLMETRKAQLQKIVEMEKKIAEQRIILKRLERDHPEYAEEWVGVYNEERKKTGISTFIPGERQFEDYDSSNLEDLLQKYGDHKPEAIGKSSIVKDDGPEEYPLIGRPHSLQEAEEVSRSVKSTKK